MADLSSFTQDVTITDNTSGNFAEVTADKELRVYDDKLFQAVNSPVGTAFDEKLYAITYSFNLANNNETDILLIKNPISSGVKTRLWKVKVGVLSNVTATFRIYYNPTITANGTTRATYNTNSGSSNTAAFEAYTLPTISARGNEVSLSIGRQGDTTTFLD